MQFKSQFYLKGIEGAAEDEQAVISQGGNHSQISGVTNEVDLADAGVVMDHLHSQEGSQVYVGSSDYFHSKLVSLLADELVTCPDWMDGWMDKWTDEWMDGHYTYVQFILICFAAKQ